jgi:hypothetical protein
MSTDPVDQHQAAADGLRLVFGASGYIGSHLVPRLLAEGIAVRASSRNRASLEARGWQGAELAEADALDPASLDQALAGIDTAYYLVHSMGAGKDFGRLDLEAAANFAAAAERAGVARIVYLGGLVPDDADSEHIVSRRDTGEVLRRGRVPGDRTARRHHRRARLRRLRGDARPGLPPARDGHAALGARQVAAHRAGQPAHLPGSAAADPEAAKGRVFDAGGPET